MHATRSNLVSSPAALKMKGWKRKEIRVILASSPGLILPHTLPRGSFSAAAGATARPKEKHLRTSIEIREIGEDWERG